MSSEPREYLRHIPVEVDYLISPEDWFGVRGFGGRRDAPSCDGPESRDSILEV